MKVAYLHGLESPNYGPKVDWLNDKFDTYVPKIDYRNEDAFENVLFGCRNADLIVGSSMGGYFAYLIGQHLSVPTLLFNPAVVSRTFDPVVELSNRNGTKNKVYLGKNDNVIKGSKIKKYFSNEGVGSFRYTTYDGGHRVPDEVFISAISETLKIKEKAPSLLPLATQVAAQTIGLESKVHSFESFHNIKLLEDNTYSDYPEAAKKNAKKAIDWKEEHGRDEVTAATRVGWARAHQLAKGENLSADTVKRMSAFNRHRKNSKIDSKYKDTPWKDNGYVAWLTWGGDEGIDWAIRTSKEIQE